jgi:mercuric reductase
MTATSRRATLEVAGMTCTDCEHHVTAALESAGAEQVSADFRRGVARFTWPGARTRPGCAPRSPRPATRLGACAPNHLAPR